MRDLAKSKKPKERKPILEFGGIQLGRALSSRREGVRQRLALHPSPVS